MINIDQSQWTYYSMPIVFSSTHPRENLALEHSLFELYESECPAIVLFYKNSPSVVVGKHQNPWYEADVQWLDQENIPLIRRMSGGGTVVHDLGNLNYSFFCSKKSFNQRGNLEFLKFVLVSLGVEGLDITSRGDLLLHGFKISGNAMWYKKDTVMHHGTLLFQSDLSRLSRALKGLKQHKELQMHGHWVDSKPMKVRNIRDFYSSVNEDDFLSAVQVCLSSFDLSAEPKCFGMSLGQPKMVGTYLENLRNSPRFSELIHQYESWEWNFAKTPRFDCTILGSKDNNTLVVDKGMIQNQIEDTNKLEPFLGLPSINKVFFL